MKTKFFKKLSLVLVVAMVLSLFVPAAGVFAAAKPALNSKSKYLHLSGNPGPNEFNFNIKNKKSGWKYFWESSKEEVAEVNQKNGVVTAKAVGKTTLTVTITDKDGEEVDTLKATVTVRDNIKEVTIKNPVEKLAVGVEHDYDRSFKTESGSTKKTDSITRWEVEPAEGAEIKDNGLFVAKEAGEYTITARSFQSKARHKAWSEDPEKYADYVLDSDTTKVVVSANIVEVKQNNKNKFTVEFDSSMKDTDLSKDTAKVYQVIAGKLYSTGTEMIKSLGLDDTGKFATVEIYGNLVSKGAYQFTYGDLKKDFVAADTAISEIAGIVFDDFQVKTKPDAGQSDNKVNLLDKVNAVNKDGVVIRTGSEIAAYLTFKYEGDYAYGWISGATDAYINKNGYTAKFIATYKNFVYDETTKTYNNVEFVDDAIGLGVDSIVSVATMQFALNRSGRPDDSSSLWNTTGFSVPASDTGYQIFTRYKENTDPSWAGWRGSKGTDKVFTYVSTDHSKLVITGNYLYPSAQGVVTVLVQENNNTVGAFELTIVASRAYASAELKEHAVSLGNRSDLSADTEKKTLVVVNKDTMGDAVRPSWGTPEFVNGPTGARPSFTISYATGDLNSGDYANVNIEVNAAGAKEGTFQYKLNLTSASLGYATKTVHFYVNVLEGNTKPDGSAYTDADVVRWTVELNNLNVDLKRASSAKDVKVNVYGYNSNNARIAALNASEFETIVKRTSNSAVIKYASDAANVVPVTKSGTAHTYSLARTYSTVSGPALEFVALDSYVVEAKVAGTGATRTNRPVDSYINSEPFTFQDTTEKRAILENASVSKNKGTIAAAVNEAFKFQVNGADISEANLGYKVTKGGYSGGTWILDGTTSIAKGDNIYVEEVYYTTKWSDASGTPTITYTIKVNQAFTITD